jgi:hypothetical protein
MNKYKETLRKYVAAALCDFLAYVTSIEDPIIVGGQYPRDKMLSVFSQWCFDRQINIEITCDDSKLWLNSCQQGNMIGSIDAVPPPISSEIKETIPDFELIDDEKGKSYFEGDEWKPEEDRPKKWVDEGEDWKKGDNDEENAAPA